MPHDPTEMFIRSLTECQDRLYGYIFSLLGNHHVAADVLQERNLVLWRQYPEFREGAEFLPWACGIARLQVLAYLRDEKRKQARFVPAELAELLHEEVAAQSGSLEKLQEALRHCVARLAPGSRELVENRDVRNQPLQAIADATQRNLSAVKVALMRVRLALTAWIRLDALPDRHQALLLTDGFEVGHPHWQIVPPGDLRLGIRSPSPGPERVTVNYSTATVFGPGQIGVWSFVAVVYDRHAGKVRHYLNGRLASTTPLRFNQPLQIGSAEIGNWGPHPGPQNLARAQLHRSHGRVHGVERRAQRVRDRGHACGVSSVNCSEQTCPGTVGEHLDPTGKKAIHRLPLKACQHSILQIITTMRHLRLRTPILGLTIGLSILLAAFAGGQVVYEGTSGAGKGKHIVLLAGDGMKQDSPANAKMAPMPGEWTRSYKAEPAPPRTAEADHAANPRAAARQRCQAAINDASGKAPHALAAEPAAATAKRPQTVTPPAKGERIVLIGNGLAERDVYYSRIETELALRFPEQALILRNMGRVGDTPGFRPHPSRASQWAFPGAEKFHPDKQIHKGKGFYGTPERLIKLSLFGLTGPIEVNGQKFDGQVPMTAFGGLLDDNELAAVLTFVRNSFGNQAEPITPAAVRKVRAANPGRLTLYNTEELLKEPPLK